MQYSLQTQNDTTDSCRQFFRAVKEKEKGKEKKKCCIEQLWFEFEMNVWMVPIRWLPIAVTADVHHSDGRNCAVCARILCNSELRDVCGLNNDQNSSCNETKSQRIIHWAGCYLEAPCCCKC